MSVPQDRASFRAGARQGRRRGHRYDGGENP